MNFEDFEQSTGWRPVFNTLPFTRNMAQKTILPLSLFYSPFLAQPNSYNCPPAICTKCKGSVNCFANRDKQSRRWTCNFCGEFNPYLTDMGQAKVEEFIEGKAGDNGIFFIIDLCVDSSELSSIKETIIKAIKKMPQNIFVGLVVFNRNVSLYDFSDPKSPRFICMSGKEDYSANNYLKLKQSLGLVVGLDPRQPSKIILSKFYVPLAQNQGLLIEAINQLQSDSNINKRQDREKRATGCALQIAINIITMSGINTRFVSLIGGPCTIGPGKVVDLPLKKTIRVYMDIFQNTQNAQHVQTATKFYQSLQKILIASKCTLDIWAYGLDQFGFLQMKDMVNTTGGLLAMHQLFNHFIFQNSFQKFYEPNEQGLFKFVIASTLSIKLSKQMKINGIIGTCKSLLENVHKTAHENQIGEGGTSLWYTGGITEYNSLCIFINHSDLAASQNRQRGLQIQAITNYKLSDNRVRTRVSTIHLEYLREVQIRDIIRGFDQQAATVMLARLAAKKSEIEQVLEVRKWLDRLLLKFTVKFAHFQKNEKGSFKLPAMMKHFPQFMYHLRRSGFINPFGCPPDQSIYMKTCMHRELISNCMMMIQPALLKYTTENIQPQPVELDLQQLQDDAVLLFDSYFNVLVWYGDHVKGWKDQKLDQNPDYEYLKDLFTIPMEDAGQLIYDRVPVSNFYQTFKNDGKQRYLKSRLNPSQSLNTEYDGHFVTDDAPIKIFMDFLVKSVVNYNE